MNQKIKIEEIVSELTFELINTLKTKSLKKWTQPWLKNGFHTNVKTKNKYNFWNSKILNKALEKNNYKYPIWGSIKQWNLLGHSIKKGEKSNAKIIVPISEKLGRENGTPNSENNKSEKEEQANDEIKYKFRTSPLFNIEQTNADLNLFTNIIGPIPLNQSNKIIKFIKSIKHNSIISHAIENPIYSIALDQIQLPSQSFFKTEEDFYITYLHELGHWTNHFTRLNRKPNIKVKEFEAKLAFEEITAEICSALLGTAFGFERDLQHPEYILDWINKLEKYPFAIYQAGSCAQSAAQYLCIEAGEHAPTSWPIRSNSDDW